MERVNGGLCVDRYLKVLPGEVCCPSPVEDRVSVGQGDSCCAGVPYSSTGSQMCCGGMLISKGGIAVETAGVPLSLTGLHMCCEGMLINMGGIAVGNNWGALVLNRIAYVCGVMLINRGGIWDSWCALVLNRIAYVL